MMIPSGPTARYLSATTCTPLCTNLLFLDQVRVISDCWRGVTVCGGGDCCSVAC